MKQYVILFLLLLSQCAIAPNLSELSNNTQKISKTISIPKPTNTEEIKEDSISINLIKKFKFSKFNKEERRKVREVSNSLGIKEQWLYKIIYIESRGMPTAVYYKKGDDKDPSIRCNYRATGLIQFLPSTAEALGTSTAELYEMSICEQLDYVEKYLKLASHGKKIKTITNLYLAVFYPSCIGLQDNHVIGSKYSDVANWNKRLDVNKDSTLTINDVKLFVANVLL
jgi:hypothetical protein